MVTRHRNTPHPLEFILSVLLRQIHSISVLTFSGSDGVFDINRTSGCITLNTYPSLLRNELYEIKVKVLVFFLSFQVFFNN